MNLVNLLTQHSHIESIFEVSKSGDVARPVRGGFLTDVRRLARAFERLQIGSGDIVLIVGGNRAETLASILAAIAIGAAAAPVNPQRGTAAIGQMARRLRPKCCVVESYMADDLDLSFEFNPELILIGASRAAGARHFHRYDTLVGDSAYDRSPFADVEPDRVALVLSTSGSTGTPKLVYRTHGQLASFVEHNHTLFSQYCVEGPGGRAVPNPLLTILPVSHLSGLGYCMEGLYAGTPVYLMERFDVAEVLRLVTTLRCGLLIMIPTMYEVLLDELEQQPGADVACLKYCLYGGEACPQPLAAKIERALGVKPICVYGLTECLPGIGHSREALLGGKIEANSCGTQLFGEIKLVDEHGRESTELGELWVRNGTIPKPVVRGDVNERVTADGWFCTGDLMRRDERGSFFFQGRSDEMFVCNGNNLYPAQVEGMLLDHVDVERVCAAPIKNKLGHTIPAVMVRRRHEVSERDLLRFARLHGPSYAVPAFIRFVDQFPFGSSGKIDRARVATELQRSYDLARHES